MAASPQTAVVSPEDVLRPDLSGTKVRSYKIPAADDTETFDTGNPTIKDWAIRTDSGGTISASLVSTTGVFTFSASAAAAIELFIWADDVSL